MSNIETNVPLAVLDTDQYMLINGLSNPASGKVLSFKAQLEAANQRLRGAQTVLLESTADFAQFDNGLGEYEIPHGTLFREPAGVVFVDKPLKFLGDFGYKGEPDGSKVSILAQTFDGPLIHANNAKFAIIDSMIFLPASLLAPTPAPNLNASLFNIENATNGNQFFATFTIAQGYGDLGFVRGFDFIYFRETLEENNLQGLKLKGNLCANIATVWQNGLGNGTVRTYEAGVNYAYLSDQFYILNPSETAWNIVDSPFLQGVKVDGGIYAGSPAQAFVPGSLTQKDPRILISGFSPVARSTIQGHYVINGDLTGGTTENPAASETFQPFTNQIILASGGEERLQVQGTGANTRIVVTSKEERKLKIDIKASLEGSNASTVLGVGIGAWNTTNPNPSLTPPTILDPGDINIDSSTTLNGFNLYDIVSDTFLPVAGASNFATITASGEFVVNEGDYIKCYFWSSSTSTIDVAKVIITLTEI